MADNRLNKTGLRYLLAKLNSFFAKQTDFTDLSGRVDDIISEGGEPNTIEVIKVNGTAQTVTNKEVDIDIPTQVSDLTDGDAVATKTYVNQNGGKIDKIKINGVEQTIDGVDKSVSISVPTAVSDLSNDSGFQTSEQVTAAINTAVAAAQHLTKSVVSELPASGSENVLYLVPDDNGGSNKDMYLWDGSQFVLIGNTETDLAGYWNETNLVAITTSEIDEVWNSVFSSTAS